MKTLLNMIIMVMTCSVFMNCSAGKVEKPKIPYYLAHNLWYENPSWIEAINFKQLQDVIPVGTEVVDIEVYSGRRVQSLGNSCITFGIPGDSKTFRIMVNDRYQTGVGQTLSMEALCARTFTAQPFDEMIIGFKPEEIENIRSGTIQKGMSKDAVLMSWGYPPLHMTPSLDEPVWYYWQKRVIKTEVRFDENDRVLKSTWYGNGGNAVDVIE